MKTISKTKIILNVMLVSAVSLSGCASIVTGHNQGISVETRDRGQAVMGATCKLENNKGTWFLTTPGTVMVRRSYDALHVACSKEEYTAGIRSVQSATKGIAYGNIFFGGIVGGAIDVGSGAAFDYPSLIQVDMPRIPAPAALIIPEKPVIKAKKPTSGKCYGVNDTFVCS